ncbi:dienelactone hydrolase family protein [Salinisphaera hydrothermalis]|uniref:Dienelactone hydrolase n=1 Tax=Salinisphaera hydrothermalis (strain C41B8) TaxID=1304275 RepID=A0A084IPL9_SALHC|nr:dienelactone hydrolase family protein [Salinisphaera hydrothermalis]KEZ78653.1 dienelactone hydrolase [Salinisphaera hydrothermalis C41B8]
MSRALNIQAADGTIDAHIFTPDDADGALPAVVLFTDIGGLRPCYHDKAQTIADDGYAVLMPNIYYRDQAGPVVPEGKSFRDSDVRPTLFEYAGHLTPDAQARDFEALIGAIDAEAEFDGAKIGVVGYCMTGAFALRMAARHAERVVAAAGFHSARLAAEDDEHSPLGLVDMIKARVFLGHADGDELMPPEQIGRLDAALAKAGVAFTTELFAGAGHGFTAFDAPVYDEAADARHYKRLSTLFEETLR